MYDTRPDIKSYVYAFRRLWWVLVSLVVVAVIAGTMIGGSETVRVRGVVQLQDPAALAAVSGTSAIYDTKLLPSRMIERLGAVDGIDGLVVNDGSDPMSFEIGFVVSGEDVADAVAAFDGVMSEIWNDVFIQVVAPARAWVDTAIEQLTAQKAALDGVPGDTAALERSGLQSQLVKVEAASAAIDSMEESVPALQNVEELRSSGGRLKSLLLVAAALFLGCGVVIAAGLFDQRVRRRSILERNGLTVLAVDGPGFSGLDVVAAGLVASKDGSAVGGVVVAGCGAGADTDRLRAALTSDDLVGEVAVVDDLVTRSADFVRLARSAEVVVISVRYGNCSYVTVLEAARTAITGGADNVCAVVEIPRSSRMGEALS